MIRHTLNGIVLEIPADVALFFLERWTPPETKVQDARDAIELAAAEILAGQHQLHVEWTDRPVHGHCVAVLYEREHYVDSETWPLGLTGDGRRIYAALIVLKFLKRLPAGAS